MPYAEKYADLLRPENNQCAKVYEQHACEIRRDLHRTLPSHHLFASCGGKRGQVRVNHPNQVCPLGQGAVRWAPCRERPPSETAHEDTIVPTQS